MTGRRLTAIAAQAVVVGALLIVISLTLLQSDDGASLFDIDAPGSETSVGPASGGDDSGGDRSRSDARNGRGDGPMPSTDSAAAALPGDGVAPTASAPLVGGPPGSTDENLTDTSPPDDQYLGSITRLDLATE